MRGVKITNRPGSYVTHKLLTSLAVVLGLLTTILLIYSQRITNITGYNVLTDLYGNLAPMVLVVTIVIIIAIYLKIVEN